MFVAKRACHAKVPYAKRMLWEERKEIICLHAIPCLKTKSLTKRISCSPSVTLKYRLTV